MAQQGKVARKWCGAGEDEEDDLFVRLEEPLLTALSSRMSCQPKEVAPFSIYWVKIETDKSAMAFNFLVQVCPGLTVVVFRMKGDIGREGFVDIG